MTEEFHLPFVVIDVWGILNLDVTEDLCYYYVSNFTLALGSTFNKRIPGFEQIPHVECLMALRYLPGDVTNFIPLEI